MAAVSDAVDGLIVPRLQTPQERDDVWNALRARQLSGLPVIAGIESAVAVMNLRELALPPLAGLYFGAEDFAFDMGGRRTLEGAEVAYARAQMVMAARAGGIIALDQVVPDFRNDDHFVAEAMAARNMGYSGKLCIHPRQVPLALQVFSPSDEELDYNRRLLEAYDAAVAAGKGAISFEGQMVDSPVALRARAIVAAAG